MPEPPTRFGKGFLLVLAIGISLVFFAMVSSFVVAVLFAAILAGLLHPVYRRLLRWTRGRKGLASATTVLIVLLLIIIPATLLVGVIAAQAFQISETVTPWIEQQLAHPDALDTLLEELPWLRRLAPYKAQIETKLGELVGKLGSFFVSSLAATTQGTAVFFFQLFVMLYAMFFFLMDGKRTLERVLYYVPLRSHSEDLMVDRFLSVSRATLKGTLVVGLVQGALAGAAFFVIGIEGPVFWGAIMGVLSIIPGIGAALVWIPAAIYLFAVGRGGAAIGLVLWCALVVGSVDNLLRPRLVGKDTQMSDLMILLSTLGGLAVFGFLGIVIGPIVAALYLTCWELYGHAFADVLPERPPVED